MDNVIRRGTTPTITFNLPFNTDELQKVSIAFNQNKNLIFEKTIDDCTLSEKALSIKLTQEDTLSFSKKGNITFQFRGLTKDGNAIASEYNEAVVKDVLKDGVL